METFFASIPILVLIVLMGVFKVAGDKSSIITLLITAFLAILAFHSPVPDTVNSLRDVEGVGAYSVYYSDGDIQL